MPSQTENAKPSDKQGSQAQQEQPSEPSTRQASGSLEPGSIGIANDVRLESSGRDEPIIGGNTINQLNHDQLQAEAAFRGLDAANLTDSAIRDQLVRKANEDMETRQRRRDAQARLTRV